MPARAGSGYDSPAVLRLSLVRIHLSSFLPLLLVACAEDASLLDLIITRPDSYSVVQDRELSVSAGMGVLANDAAPEGRPLTAALASGPAEGSLNLQADGSFRYGPPPGFTGTVGFTYVAKDGVGEARPTEVTITVQAVADAPLAAPDFYRGTEDTALSVEVMEGVLANDSDPRGRPLLARVLEQPENGSVLMAPTGRFTYTPRADHFGPDTFVYGADNGESTSRGVVTIELEGTPDAPRATDDRVTGPEDEVMRFPGTYDLLANDVDPDGDELTVVIDTEPGRGTLVRESDGTLVYTPERDYVGADSFRYSVNDGVFDSNVATVFVTLTAVNDPPTARAMKVSVVRNRSLVALLDADDVDGDALTYRLESPPENGTVVVGEESGAFTYVPATDYLGPDAFSFSVSDGALSSAVATVSIDVVAPPPPAVLRLFPERGSTERPVQLFGAGFLEQEGSVTVGGRAATVVSWSDAYVVIEVPSGFDPGPQPVVVTTHDNRSGPAASYEIVPWIDGVSSALVRSGDTLELEGDGFGSVSGSVRFGGTQALIQSWSQTRVVLTVPAVAGEQPIELVTSGGARSNVWRQPVAPGTWVMPPIPVASEGDLAIWTGTEILYLYGSRLRGIRYDPLHDRWRSMARAPGTGGEFVRAVWTGRELLAFANNLGLRYDPTLDVWQPVSLDGGHLDRSNFAVAWTGSHAVVWGGRRGSTDLQTGALYDPATDTWTAMSTTGAPPARPAPHAVWTGAQLLVFGGSSASATGGRYDPASDRWRPMTSVDAPAVSDRAVVVWSGEEVLVQGGGFSSSQASTMAARYHPITDTWTNIEGAPSRNQHAGVWTGRELIVRGGCQATSSGCSFTTRGFRWDPGSDEWTEISNSNTPIGDVRTTCVWTGKDMVVFGGNGLNLQPTNDGGLYDPRADSWTRMDVIQRPVVRTEHVGVWAGTELIVWGGGLGPSAFPNATNAGARFDLVTGLWTPMSGTDAPASRMRGVGVWTGTQLLVWGGHSSTTLHDSGGRYTLGTDSWAGTSFANAPEARRRATGVWTGTQMLVWGGENTTASSGGTRLQTGGRYNPSSDVWTAISTTNAPTGRLDHSAVWTGSRMLVWGGADSGRTNTGGAYDPSSDSWTELSLVDAPVARNRHAAVWTGSRMLVYGGDGAGASGTGGSYDPASNSWAAIKSDGAPALTAPLAVWTGTQLLLHGAGGGGAYDPATDAWSTIPLTSLPSGTAVGSSVWTGTEWLIFGRNHGHYTDVIRYVP